MQGGGGVASTQGGSYHPVPAPDPIPVGAPRCVDSTRRADAALLAKLVPEGLLWIPKLLGVSVDDSGELLDGTVYCHTSTGLEPEGPACPVASPPLDPGEDLGGGGMRAGGTGDGSRK